MYLKYNFNNKKIQFYLQLYNKIEVKIILKKINHIIFTFLILTKKLYFIFKFVNFINYS